MPSDPSGYLPILLIVLGAIFIAIGIGATIRFKGLILSGQPGKVIGQVASFALGLVLIGAGIVSAHTATDQGGNRADAAPTAGATRAAVGISLDSPKPGERVTVACETPDSCAIEASGRADPTGGGTNTYLLVAYDEGSDAAAEYYVQYDSTWVNGVDWSAKAYLYKPAAGARLLLKVVSTRHKAAAPARGGGLKWSGALERQLGAVSESAVVPVIVGSVV